MRRTLPPYLRALRSRDFRIYFAGQTISLAGTWMQQAALLWLAYRVSNSAFMLGAIGFASQIPILIFGAVGGVWVDRLDRRRLLMWTQALAMAQSFLLAALAWFDLATPAALLLLAFSLGCLNAIDVPARQTIAAQLVEPADLQNAIALNSIVVQLGRFVGPALAGIVVTAAGEAACFLLNTPSYLAVLAALAVVRTRFSPGRPAPTLHALAEGIRYIRAHRRIRLSLLLVAATSFLAMPYTVLMPLVARQLFGGDATTYGLLVAGVGAGSLLAALVLAGLATTNGLRAAIAPAAGVAGACLMLLGGTSTIEVAYAVLPILGFGVIIVFSGSNTLIQMQVKEEFRGRVMAIYVMAFLGIAPLGSLVAGTLAEVMGVRFALFLLGLLVVCAAAAYRRAADSTGTDHP